MSEYTLARIEEATKKIVKELNITGPFNIQYIAKNSEVSFALTVSSSFDSTNDERLF